MNPILIQANNSESAWIECLKLLFEKGKTVAPRGMVTIEGSPGILVMENPDSRVILNPVRKWNLGFGILEALWIMCGRNEANRVTLFNRDIGKFSDDGVTFHGAYGKRIIHDGINQIKTVINSLKKDKDSRQAIITIYDHVLDEQPTKDRACSLNLMFLIREGRLDLIANMRSNDIIRGFPYDSFNFSFLQNIIANELGIPLGSYTHISNSMHLYETDFIWAQRILEAAKNPDNVCQYIQRCNIDFKYDDLFKLDKLIDIFLSDTLYIAKKHDIDKYLSVLENNKIPGLSTYACILTFYYAINMRDYEMASGLHSVLQKEATPAEFKLIDAAYTRRFKDILKEAKNV